MQILLILLNLLTFLGIANTAIAVTASSLSDLKDKVATVSPGTTIYLENKTYSGKELIFITKPLTIQGVGAGTKITGEVTFLIRSPDVSMKQLTFDSPKVHDGRAAVIQVEAENFHLHKVRMSGLKGRDRSSHYVLAGGPAKKMTVEKCTFVKSEAQGIMVHLSSAKDGSRQSHIVKSCYFTGSGPRPRGPRPRANGNEALTLGSIGSSDGGNQVLYNIFSDVDSESEILSTKSRNNTIRNNVFRYCYGAVTLRGGHGSVIEHNYFMNGKYDWRATYLCVWGDNHIIRRNYFNSVACQNENSYSKNQGSISIFAGNTTSIDHYNKEAAHNVTVEGNIVAYSTNGFPALGIGSNIGLDGCVHPPTSLKIRDNILFGSSSDTGKRIDYDDISLSDHEMSGNFAWPVAGTSQGTQESNPGLVKDPKRANYYFYPGNTNIGPAYPPPTTAGCGF